MSAVWDLYQARMDVRGVNQRTESLKREKHTLLTRLRDNLSYQVVNIDGIERTVAIINTDNLDTKKIYSLPNENLHHGGIVDFADNKWLITEKDAANEVYTRAVMRQCNYLLRWVNDKKQIVEQWSIVEDGTKLKHTPVCNSLVCWKRHAKRIPLIAGNPLKPYTLQRGFEIKADAIA